MTSTLKINNYFHVNKNNTYHHILSHIQNVKSEFISILYIWPDLINETLGIMSRLAKASIYVSQN